MSWSHAPFHFNAVEGVYIVTCGTYLKRPSYREASDRDLFESQLFAENAVHHGVIANAMNYKWCSARWFADHASIGLVKAIEQASLDCINEPDDF